MSEKNMSRRDFFKFGAKTAAVGAALLYPKETQVVKNLYQALMAENNISFREKIEKEKELLISDIKNSISNTNAEKEAMKETAEMLAQMNRLPQASEEYAQLNKKRNEIILKWREKAHRNGSIRTLLLEKANPYAEKIMQNPQVLEKLSFLKTAAKEKGFNFEYVHNYSPAYIKLQNIDVYSRIDALTKDFDPEKRKKISQEDLFYYIFNEDFDPNLTPKKISEFLDSKSGNWKETKATNNGNYANNNNPEAFSVFELNRIKKMAGLLQNPKFKQSVFKVRDQDIKDEWSECGGIIPNQAERISSVAPKMNTGNYNYTPSEEEEMFRPDNLAGFHFHATGFDTSKYLGPSDGDCQNAFPGIVFTSLDEQKICAHFYVSRQNAIDESVYDQIDVISMGVMEKK